MEGGETLSATDFYGEVTFGNPDGDGYSFFSSMNSLGLFLADTLGQGSVPSTALPSGPLDINKFTGKSILFYVPEDEALREQAGIGFAGRASAYRCCFPATVYVDECLKNDHFLPLVKS